MGCTCARKGCSTWLCKNMLNNQRRSTPHSYKRCFMQRKQWWPLYWVGRWSCQESCSYSSHCSSPEPTLRASKKAAHTVRHQSQHSVPPKRKPLNQEAVVMLIIGIYKRLSNVQQVRRAAERTVKWLKEKLSRAWRKWWKELFSIKKLKTMRVVIIFRKASGILWWLYVC